MPVQRTSRRRHPLRRPLALAVAALTLGSAGLAGCGGGLSGTYAQSNGTGRLEFRGERVYITTVLGMTFVANYEIDGDRIIIKAAGGSQVYTRAGDTLDAGGGITFVRQ